MSLISFAPRRAPRLLRPALGLVLLVAAGCEDGPASEDDVSSVAEQMFDASVSTLAADASVAGPQDAAAPAQPDASTPPAVAAGDLFVAPTGVAGAAGTIGAPTSLVAALTRVAPGARIWLRGGTYAFNVQITIARENSGTQAARKQLLAYAGERPILDFSSQPYGKDGNPRGLQIDGSHWHVKGLTVRGSADNGIYVAGNGNIIESCVTHGNRDTGLQLGRWKSTATTQAEWPRDNLILNCESYDNYDLPPGSGENADGFAAKLTVGPGNVFRGCDAHHNIDDGWDLYTKTDTGPIGSVTIDQSVAHHNGTLTSGVSNAQGDRNGFKLGGEKIPVPHVVTRSVAYANGKNGFTWNSNPGAIRLANNLAFDNAEGNYNFGSNSVPTAAVFTNNVSVWTKVGAKADKTVGSDVAGSNVWATATGSRSATGKVASPADFIEQIARVTPRRSQDGSLDLSVFRLAPGSDLINAGTTPLGVPYLAPSYLGLPDLGVFETR